jgi:hypothetical protein
VLRSLEPGGTLIIAECERRWPVTRIANRHVFQMGALGGCMVDEYFHGGPRVAEYLARCGSHRRSWERRLPMTRARKPNGGSSLSIGSQTRPPIGVQF